MKNNTLRMKLNRILAAGLTAGMCFALPVYAEMENAETAVEETVVEDSEAEETAETESKEVEAEELLLKLTAEKELTAWNMTGKKAAELYVKKVSEEVWGENVLNVEMELEEKLVYDLKLVSEDNEIFLFYNLPLNEMKELSVFSGETGTYVIYTDAEEKEVSTKEFPVVCTEEPVTIYTTYGLNVRAIPTTDGQILGGLQPGEETVRYGVAENGWCMIKRGDIYAYITGDYVTEDASEAERIREQARAAAAAAAAQSAGNSNSGNSNSGNGNSGGGNGGQKQETGRTEVSREVVPGCDDPDHGTIFITYSDGSIEAVDY